jgi:hypothetical protein
LLLSLRFEDKFECSKELLKKIQQLLAEYNLDGVELEWLATNWCKIKRDMWKSKKITYTDADKRATMVDYFEVKATDSAQFNYLFEELKTYYYLKSLDTTIAMYEEIYFTLEKLDNLHLNDPLLKSRIQLEIAQFKCSNYYKNAENKFTLSTEDYCDKARRYLSEHKCWTSLAGVSLETRLNEMSFNEVDEDKENNNNNSNSNNNSSGTLTSRKRLSSPSNDVMLIEEANTDVSKRIAQSKRRRVKPKSPLVASGTKQANKISFTKCESPKQPAASSGLSKNGVCDCAEYKMIQFQIDLFRFLCDYARVRQKMLNSVTNLIESRIKVKDTTHILTNTDNLELQTTTNECLICKELIGGDSNGSEANATTTKNDEYASLMQQLDNCMAIIDAILLKKKDHKAAFSSEVKHLAKPLLKQFYDSIDLLAQLYAFFGYLNKRCRVLACKLELMNFLLNEQQQPQAAARWTSLSNFDSIYSSTVISLLKSFVRVNMCDNFELVNNQLLNLNGVESGQKSTD